VVYGVLQCRDFQEKVQSFERVKFPSRDAMKVFIMLQSERVNAGGPELREESFEKAGGLMLFVWFVDEDQILVLEGCPFLSKGVIEKMILSNVLLRVKELVYVRLREHFGWLLGVLAPAGLRRSRNACWIKDLIEGLTCHLLYRTRSCCNRLENSSRARQEDGGMQYIIGLFQPQVGQFGTIGL
jgi:hypothetical protein